MGGNPGRASVADGRSAPAFTLIELLVVISILVILISLITVAVFRAIKRAKIARAQTEISNMSAALSGYCRDLGTLPPDTGHGLPRSPRPRSYDPGSLWRHLVKEVYDARTKHTYGPYLVWKQKDLRTYSDPVHGKSYLLVDPWGNPYGFVGSVKRVVHQRGSFDVFSAGPDGETACDEPGAAPNRAYDGIDNDGDGVVDDRGELGAAARNGDASDDVNNW